MVTKLPWRETVRLLSSTRLQSVEAKQRNHGNGETMNTRLNWIFGLAGLGLAGANPVHAAPDFMEDAFIVAQRDQGDEVRQDRRGGRKDGQRAPKREAGRDEAPGYGYGYERRQQQDQSNQNQPGGKDNAPHQHRR
jgi:hypothetical protein